MLHVRSLHWRAYEVAFERPFVTAAAVWNHRRGVLVRLQTDAGLCGLGEVAALVHGDAQPLLAGIMPHLVGLSVEQAVRSLALLPESPLGSAVHSALETACCDVLAQAAGVSLARFLDGRSVGMVPVNATIGVDDPAAAAEAARSAVQAGYRAVKLKVGRAPSPAVEAERVAAVRAAIGPDCELRLDANAAWSPLGALAYVRAFVPYNISYVEQPVAGDAAVLAAVRARCPVRIAADESASSLRNVHALLLAGAVDVVIVKPSVLGGPLAARAVLEAVGGASIDAVVTTSLEAGVGTMMTWHVAATLGEAAPACGLATLSLLADSLLDEMPRLERGQAVLPTAAGLGAIVRPDAQP